MSEGDAVCFTELQISAPGVRSLQWTREGLTDWVGGGTLYTLEGETRSRHLSIGYRFDAALVSPSGRYAVVYERLGTKGVILEGSTFIREINRSFYCADSYEYPIALFQLPDGDEAIVHCPEEYNILEIELLSTGERLSRSANRIHKDVFHSRLRVNSIGTLLAEAAWFWHPWEHVLLYDLAGALKQSTKLDHETEWTPPFGYELSDAMFCGNTLMVVTPSRPEDDGEAHDLARPNTVGLFDSLSGVWKGAYTLESPIGLFFPLSLRYIVGFYEHPKVFDLHTGQVVQRWPTLQTNTQESCIVNEKDLPPPLAMDSEGLRFAVWQDDVIHVVQFDRDALAMG